MQRNRGWLLIGVLIVAIAAGGCADKKGSGAESEGDKAATLIVVDGSDIPRVDVTDLGARRIGLTMAPVEGGESLSVPYGAIVYDPNGGTWVYASPEDLVFERTPVTVVEIRAERAVLSSGPAAGTEVVSVGTAELYGVEQGIGA